MITARKAYIETSVWGALPPDQDPVLHQPTIRFLRQCEERLFAPYISNIVSREIQEAPEEDRELIFRCMSDIAPIDLPLTEEILDLADRFIAEQILPVRRLEDARHVACAIVNELDILVSWNYRHIANMRKAERFNAVAVLAGWGGRLRIHTPLEVLQW
jgi:predicted nucleic acid-binding protein